MDLKDVRRVPSDRKPRKRKGRGESSGLGRTSGRGDKGAKQRSGWGGMNLHEGGQMPLARRLPKRGFNNPAGLRYALVNVKDLNVFADGTEVGPSQLQERGLIGHIRDGVKVLGNGKLDRKLTVKAHGFSGSAREKVQAAGGEIRILRSLPSHRKPELVLKHAETGGD